MNTPSVSIHPDTKLGYVHLTVADLDISLPFYQQALGFKIHRRERNTVHLGAGDGDILVLTASPDAPRPGRATGLYHFAVLVPNRRELARVLKRLMETETRVQGFADHHVSEAIYLADPDGNGIEIYRDRPREQWHDSRGQFFMGTEMLDIGELMTELEGHEAEWQGLAQGTVLGHMHLKVADIARARAFYVGVLGFDEMMNLGSAGFVSAGGYHHHLGYNIWESRAAPPPSRDAIGLRYFVIRLPNAEEFERVVGRVRGSGMDLEETDAGLLVRDPSDNGLVLTIDSGR